MPERVLLVDDEPQVLALVARVLQDAGFRTRTASTGAEARRLFEETPPLAVVLDLNLPDARGERLLAEFHAARPAIPVVMLTGEGEVEIAVECMRLGARDFLQKPFDPARLVATLRNACERRRLEERVVELTEELRGPEGFGAILGESPALAQALALLRKAAAGDVTVLLEGESGTGKEVAARAIHAGGARRAAPFVAVNCGAIAEGLAESELFGHERGAFTGAAAARRGHFERAHGGTLLLDEVGDLSLDLQVKLLRVLQEGVVLPVGASDGRPVDVRVVAATNRNLRAEVAARRFREDLFYRLAVFPVRLPALRDRGGDLDLLAAEFLARFAARHRLPVRPLSPEAARALRAHRWPGNVREMMNVLERACLVEEGPRISLGSLPEEVLNALDEPGAEGPAPAAAGEIEPLEAVEKRAILAALRVTGGRVKEAAARLGIGKATLYRKLEAYGVAPTSSRSSPGGSPPPS